MGNHSQPDARQELTHQGRLSIALRYFAANASHQQQDEQDVKQVQLGVPHVTNPDTFDPVHGVT